MFAATNDDPKIAKLLIESGAKLNAKAHDGKTALMFAAADGRTDCGRDDSLE